VSEAPARPASYFRFLDFGPLFRVPLNRRHFDTSPLVNRHSLRPPFIGTEIVGRTNPRPSQRCSVIGWTPINLAAWDVENVFIALIYLAQ